MSEDSLLKTIMMPLVLLVIVAVAYVSWFFLDLPSETELLSRTQHIFLEYGLIVAPLGAFLEALMFVGWYVPGGTVVLLGVIFAGDDVGRVVLTVILATAGLFSGYSVNYALGRYGWYRLFTKLGLAPSLKQAQHRLEKRGWLAIFLTYWQPGLASLTSTAAGVLQIPYKTFASYSLASLIFWDTMWGMIAYFFGDEAMDLLSLRFIIVLLVAWMGWSIISRKYLHKDA